VGEVSNAARKPLLAWSLTGSVLVLLAAALVLLGLNVSRPSASRLDPALIGFYGLLAAWPRTRAQSPRPRSPASWPTPRSG